MDCADELERAATEGGCTCVQCPTCKGHGEIQVLTFRNSFGVEFFKTDPCQSCKGTGLKNAEMCDECGAERQTREDVQT
jgi:DnaJ-class molecular chaperone